MMLLSWLSGLASQVQVGWQGIAPSPQLGFGSSPQNGTAANNVEELPAASAPAAHFTRGYKRKFQHCDPDVAASGSSCSSSRSSLLQLSTPPGFASSPSASALTGNALSSGAAGPGSSGRTLGRLVLTPVGASTAPSDPLSSGGSATSTRRTRSRASSVVVSPATTTAAAGCTTPGFAPARKAREGQGERNAATAVAASSSASAVAGSRKSARLGGSAPRLDEITFDLPTHPQAATMSREEKLTVVLRLLRVQAVESVKSLSTHLNVGMAGELTSDSVRAVISTAAALDAPALDAPAQGLGSGSGTGSAVSDSQQRIFLDAGSGCGRPVFLACLGAGADVEAEGSGGTGVSGPLYSRAVGVELVQAQVRTAQSIAKHVALEQALCQFHVLDMEDTSFPWPESACQASTVYSFSKGMPPVVLRAVVKAMNGTHNTGTGPTGWRVLATTTSPREWAAHGLQFSHVAAQRVNGKMVGSGSGHMVYFLLSARAAVAAGAVPHVPESDGEDEDDEEQREEAGEREKEGEKNEKREQGEGQRQEEEQYEIVPDA